jgi:hypothetical protein
MSFLAVKYSLPLGTAVTKTTFLKTQKTPFMKFFRSSRVATYGRMSLVINLFSN